MGLLEFWFLDELINISGSATISMNAQCNGVRICRASGAASVQLAAQAINDITGSGVGQTTIRFTAQASGQAWKYAEGIASIEVTALAVYGEAVVGIGSATISVATQSVGVCLKNTQCVAEVKIAGQSLGRILQRADGSCSISVTVQSAGTTQKYGVGSATIRVTAQMASVLRNGSGTGVISLAPTLVTDHEWGMNAPLWGMFTWGVTVYPWDTFVWGGDVLISRPQAIANTWKYSTAAGAVSITARVSEWIDPSLAVPLNRRYFAKKRNYGFYSSKKKREFAVLT